MKPSSKDLRLYLVYTLLAALFIGVVATIQMKWVLGMPLRPSYYIVPLLSGGVLGYLLARVKILAKRLAATSVTDALTGLHNRRWLNERLVECMENCRRHHEKLAVIMLDIDGFKAINDEHGHLAGDKTLIAVAATVREICRTTDYCVRWGGEEFLIVLPHTDSKGARILAERLRRAIDQMTFPVVGHVTCSFGVTEISGPVPDHQTLIQNADKALYLAKDSGKNCVLAYP